VLAFRKWELIVFTNETIEGMSLA